MKVSITFNGTIVFRCGEDYMRLLFGTEWVMDQLVFGEIPIAFGTRRFSFSPVYRQNKPLEFFATVDLDRSENHSSLEAMGDAAMELIKATAKKSPDDPHWVTNAESSHLPRAFDARWQANMARFNLVMDDDGTYHRGPSKE